MQKKSAKKSQPKAKKPDAVEDKLDQIIQIIDHIEQMMAADHPPQEEDSPDTPDEVA